MQSTQIARIDADQQLACVRLLALQRLLEQPARARKITGIERFEQHEHPVLPRTAEHPVKRPVIEHRNDEQHAAGSRPEVGGHRRQDGDAAAPHADLTEHNLRPTSGGVGRRIRGSQQP